MGYDIHQIVHNENYGAKNSDSLHFHCKTGLINCYIVSQSKIGKLFQYRNNLVTKLWLASCRTDVIIISQYDTLQI